MRKIKSVILIIFICIASFYLLMIFTLLNFPYRSSILKLDRLLREQYGLSLLVGSIAYQFPLKLSFEDINLRSDEGLFAVNFDNMFIRMRILPFSKFSSVEFQGDGMGVRSKNISVSGAFVSIRSRIRVFGLLRGREVNQIDSVQLLIGDADIERVELSGIEFKSVHLKQSKINLRGSDNGFVLERGNFNTDVIRSEIKGSLGFEKINLDILFSLTDEFYRKYPQMKGMVDSIFSDGKLRLQIEGTPKDPKVHMAGRG